MQVNTGLFIRIFNVAISINYEGWNSIKRINEFLNNEDLKDKNQRLNKPKTKNEESDDKNGSEECSIDINQNKKPTKMPSILRTSRLNNANSGGIKVGGGSGSNSINSLSSERKREAKKVRFRNDAGRDYLEHETVITVLNKSFGPEDRNKPILKDINIMIKRGESIAIVGPSGGGKSAFLAALLSEMQQYNSNQNSTEQPPKLQKLPTSLKKSNKFIEQPSQNEIIVDDFDEKEEKNNKQNQNQHEKFEIFGRLGYMSQVPFICNTTIRENILFGKPFNSERYQKAIKASALINDLEEMSEGDQTETGERGSNLSGGQRSRISLARCLYQSDELDIFLLDDPFSAVDVKTGETMFYEGINGVLKNKTKLVVLNSHFQLLDKFDRIVVFKSQSDNTNRILIDGTFKQLESIYKNEINSLLVELGIDENNDDDEKSSVAYDESQAQTQQARQEPFEAGQLETEGQKTPEEIAIQQQNDAMWFGRKLIRFDSTPTLNQKTHENVEDLFKPKEQRGWGRKKDTLDRNVSVPVFDHHFLTSAQYLESIHQRRKMLQKIYDDKSKPEHVRMLSAAQAEKSSRENINRISSKVIGTSFTSSYSSFMSNESFYDDMMAAKSFKKPKMPPLRGYSKKVARDLAREENEQQSGTVKFKTYLQYFKAASSKYGYYLLGLLLLIFLLGSASSIISDAQIASRYSDSQLVKVDSKNSQFWMLTQLAQITVSTFFSFIRLLLFSNIAIAANENLHDRMLKSLLSAPISFFEKNSQGRILNLFSKELNQIGAILPDSSMRLIQNLSLITGFTVFIVVNVPQILFLILFIMTMFLFIRRWFRKCVIQLKRIDAMSRSPIFAHFSEAFNGLATIRAFNVTEDFIKKSFEVIDRNTRAQLAFNYACQQLTIRLDMISPAFIITVSLLLTVLSHSSENLMPPELAGLSLIFCIKMAGLIQWTILESVENESNMTAIERMNQFMDIEKEQPAHIPETDPDENWPKEGSIEFDHFSMKYNEESPDFALKNLNCKIKPNERIGICGNTGAGKSSISVALLRFAESKYGKILIDGVDISKIGIRTLRSRVSLLPQHSFVFSQSIRFNLDPNGEFTDKELQEVLTEVEMDEFVQNLNKKLDYKIKDVNSTLSAGQCQLILICRALLLKPKIMILDEATASIDAHTDTVVQKVLSKRFRNCTLLSIAHRINTIMDYDRIMVLKSGQIAEFDSPDVLANDENSLFSKMIEHLRTEEEQKDSMNQYLYEDEEYEESLSKDIETQMIDDEVKTNEEKSYVDNDNESVISYRSNDDNNIIMVHHHSQGNNLPDVEVVEVGGYTEEELKFRDTTNYSNIENVQQEQHSSRDMNELELKQLEELELDEFEDVKIDDQSENKASDSEDNDKHIQ